MVKLWREEQAAHSAPLLQMPDSVTNAMHKAAFDIWAAASTLAGESVERIQTQAGEAITKAKAELSEYAGEVSRLERELEQANIKAVELQKNVDATQEKAVKITAEMRVMLQSFKKKIASYLALKQITPSCKASLPRLQLNQPEKEPQKHRQKRRLNRAGW
jgi:chromosome segregation ATPase